MRNFISTPRLQSDTHQVVARNVGHLLAFSPSVFRDLCCKACQEFCTWNSALKGTTTSECRKHTRSTVKRIASLTYTCFARSLHRRFRHRDKNRIKYCQCTILIRTLQPHPFCIAGAIDKKIDKFSTLSSASETHNKSTNVLKG